MKKKDLLIAVTVLCVAVFLAFFIRVGHKPGEMIRIMIDGDEYGTYSLFKDCEIIIENAYGYNKLIIKEGMAYMESADCPDGYCVEHKPISETNETIVCLPHKLVVEIQGADETEVIDGISQ